MTVGFSLLLTTCVSSTCIEDHSSCGRLLTVMMGLSLDSWYLSNNVEDSTMPWYYYLDLSKFIIISSTVLYFSDLYEFYDLLFSLSHFNCVYFPQNWVRPHSDLLMIIINVWYVVDSTNLTYFQNILLCHIFLSFLF